MVLFCEFCEFRREEHTQGYHSAKGNANYMYRTLAGPAYVIQEDNNIFCHPARSSQHMLVHNPQVLNTDIRVWSSWSTAMTHSAIVKCNRGVAGQTSKMFYLGCPRE